MRKALGLLTIAAGITLGAFAYQSSQPVVVPGTPATVELVEVAPVEAPAAPAATEIAESAPAASPAAPTGGGMTVLAGRHERG